MVNKNTWFHGDLEELEACPACGENLDFAEHYSRRDDFLNFPDVWHLHHCQSCQSIYLNPRPDEESLPLAYKNYYTHKAENNETLHGSSILQRLILGYLQKRFNYRSDNALKIGWLLFTLIPPLRMKLDIYGRHIPNSMCHSKTKLLDLGCGNGDFLLRTQAMGVDVTGVEPDPAAVKAMKGRGLKVLHGDLNSSNFNDDSYDYITLNHVIEHVQDPKQLLAELYRVTAAGGIIWLGLPNPQAHGLRIFKQAWKGLHPPFHLIIPSHKVLKSWLLETGFERIEFKRRGSESKGLWREYDALAKREKVGPKRFLSKILRIFLSFSSTINYKNSEETIVLARKPRTTSDD